LVELLSKTTTNISFTMPGFLVSYNYKAEVGTSGDIQLAAIIWGFSLGFGLLTGIKAAIRTKTAWHRARRAKIYIIMVWGEMIASIGFGLLGWLNIVDVVGPR
jgi:multisubunit Na+/H+ antiporter MnhE subunit